MRICPKCGAYYADSSSAFCLADGLPLVNLDPGSDKWSEGARIVEEKQTALRKQKRKLNWRRVLVGATTMLIATVVVCVVAINGVIYLKPEWLPTPSPSPLASPSPSPLPSLSPSPWASPSPTPLPSPTPTPTLTKDVNTNANVNANTNVDTHGNVNVNTNANVNTELKCSEDETIKKLVHGKIEGHPPKTGPDGLPIREAKITLSSVEYQIRFLKDCREAFGTASYRWEIKADAVTKGGIIRKTDAFSCFKGLGKWVCP